MEREIVPNCILFGGFFVFDFLFLGLVSICMNRTYKIQFFLNMKRKKYTNQKMFYNKKT